MSTKCRLRIKRLLIPAMLIGAACLNAADRFDFAAIHPAEPNLPGVFMKFLPGGGLSISGMNIRNLIWLAWQLPPERVTGGPKWIDSEKYSIEAKTAAPRASTMEAERPRIQALLHERFQLKEHWESKVSAAYELTVAPGGIKFRRDADTSGKGTILPWSIVVSELSRRLGRPVVDKTGLTGAWWIELHWSTDDGTPAGIGRTASSVDPGPSIFTAVREQLGLKLAETKTAVELLAIDSISRPTAN